MSVFLVGKDVMKYLMITRLPVHFFHSSVLQFSVRTVKTCRRIESYNVCIIMKTEESMVEFTLFPVVIILTSALIKTFPHSTYVDVNTLD